MKRCIICETIKPNVLTYYDGRGNPIDLCFRCVIENEDIDLNFIGEKGNEQKI